MTIAIHKNDTNKYIFNHKLISRLPRYTHNENENYTHKITATCIN